MRANDIYKVLCEDMAAVFEALALSLGNLTDEYCDEEGNVDIDSYENYLDDIRNKMLRIANKYHAFIQRMNPDYSTKSPLSKMLLEAERGYLSNKEQTSVLFMALRVAEQRNSERQWPLVAVK